ncbi:hypothetical protein ACGFWD_44715 [Streptomyces sp. NPDC048448]|uniref:hypothetical protein n=1 Tax=unclassified Streptomyces TaxID=2593676 RepID=UPI003417960F
MLEQSACLSASVFAGLACFVVLGLVVFVRGSRPQAVGADRTPWPVPARMADIAATAPTGLAMLCRAT